MKRISAPLACLLLAASFPSLAGPVTKIASLSPRYNSDVIEIRWQSALAGSCTTSDLAVTNAGAANANELTAFLLAAFTAGLDVEVMFGGGCDQGSNWIQTIRVVR